MPIFVRVLRNKVSILDVHSKDNGTWTIVPVTQQFNLNNTANISDVSLPTELRCQFALIILEDPEEDNENETSSQTFPLLDGKGFSNRKRFHHKGTPSFIHKDLMMRTRVHYRRLGENVTFRCLARGNHSLQFHYQNIHPAFLKRFL